jgi:hypothetical protein
MIRQKDIFRCPSNHGGNYNNNYIYMPTIEEVKKKFNKYDNYYWFLIEPTTATLLVSGDSEEQTKKKLKKLLKSKEYERKTIWRVWTHWNDPVSFGRVGIAIQNYKVKNAKLVEIPQKGKRGTVWVDDYELKVFNWKPKYIKNVLLGITKYGIDLNSVMPNPYSKFSDFS